MVENGGTLSKYLMEDAIVFMWISNREYHHFHVNPLCCANGEKKYKWNWSLCGWNSCRVGVWVYIMLVASMFIDSLKEKKNESVNVVVEYLENLMKIHNTMTWWMELKIRWMVEFICNNRGDHASGFDI